MELSLSLSHHNSIWIKNQIQTTFAGFQVGIPNSMSSSSMRVIAKWNWEILFALFTVNVGMLYARCFSTWTKSLHIQQIICFDKTLAWKDFTRVLSVYAIVKYTNAIASGKREMLFPVKFVCGVGVREKDCGNSNFSFLYCSRSLFRPASTTGSMMKRYAAIFWTNGSQFSIQLSTTIDSTITRHIS